ncbi:MAG: excinuclease ABC subunit UvrC [Actinomycetota bacterium]
MADPSWRPRNLDIPDSPGVYMFRDEERRVLYVGKAKSLRSRVPNYFTTGLHARTIAMVDSAAEVEWIVTSTEVEALQLEVTFIKEHHPRFNVRYRDDKSYPYLAITMSEEFPRAMVVRGRKRKGDRYYGPYTHAYAIRETLDLLLRVFPLRSCSKGVFDRAKSARRPCLLYDIGRCSAPCVGHVDAEQHLQIVRQFCEFMDGDHEKITKDLQDRMKNAAARLEFEQAARLRDQSSAVRRVIERQEMVTEKREDIDAIHFFGDDLEASFQVFFVRKGRMVGRKGFMVDKVEDLDDAPLVETFIENLYSDQTEIPSQVLVPVMPPSAEVLEAWLSIARDSKVTIRVPERGSKRRLLETIAENAKEAFGRERLKRATDFDARSKALSELQEQLDLPEAPLRIECFDISNLGPTEVVGSMVVFEDGLPKRSDYRKFKVNSVEGQDDFASMGEVIGRRLTRLVEASAKPRDRQDKFAYQPGLIVVDGGKGQLNAAVQVMSEVGIVGIPVVSLAKRLEEVFVPGESEPRIIPRGSEALYLLQRVRDEAHRFAVGYQRTRRAKSMTKSIVDELPGVGSSRRSALLKHFGSVKKLEQATIEQIAQVPGIGKEMARRIHEALRRT